MEYSDDFIDIYYDLCLRLSKILPQYNSLEINEEKYEATLSIAILQTMLTNFSEAYDKASSFISEHEPHNSSVLDNFLIEWGINKNNIINNNFVNENKISEVLKSIRHSLSHPTSQSTQTRYPQTGYYANELNGKIVSYVFTNSPDVNSIYDNLKNISEKTYLEMQNFLQNNDDHNQIIEFRSKNNKYGKLYLNNRPYYRLFTVELNTSQIKKIISIIPKYLEFIFKFHPDFRRNRFAA